MGIFFVIIGCNFFSTISDKLQCKYWFIYVYSHWQIAYIYEYLTLNTWQIYSHFKLYDNHKLLMMFVLNGSDFERYKEYVDLFGERRLK